MDGYFAVTTLRGRTPEDELGGTEDDKKRGSLGPLPELTWKRAGFAPADALLWDAASFDPADAQAWRHGGFDMNEAHAWRKVIVELCLASDGKPRRLPRRCVIVAGRHKRCGSTTRLFNAGEESRTTKPLRCKRPGQLLRVTRDELIGKVRGGVHGTLVADFVLVVAPTILPADPLPSRIVARLSGDIASRYSPNALLPQAPSLVTVAEI